MGIGQKLSWLGATAGAAAVVTAIWAKEIFTVHGTEILCVFSEGAAKQPAPS
jgi:hypothetical protein